MRTCLCGCGQPIPDSMRADAKYVNRSHKAMANKRRSQDLPPGYDPEALGRAYRGHRRNQRAIPYI